MHVGDFCRCAYAHMGDHDYLPRAKIQELGQMRDAQGELLTDRLWRELVMCKDFVTP